MTGRRILAYALAVATVLACGPGPALVSSPAPLPATALPTPTALPPTESPATPATPLVEATPPPPPTEAPVISVTDVYTRLMAQSSFQFDLLVEHTDGSINITGRHVREPAAWQASAVMADQRVPVEWTWIGDRRWASVPGLFVADCTDWPEAPLGGLEGDACALAASGQALLVSALYVALSSKAAGPIAETPLVDGVAGYIFSSEEGTEIRLHLSAQSGLPMTAETTSADGSVHYVFHFTTFNAPENVIENPASGFPQILHLDDARMALNSLSSFQWTATMHWQPAPSTQTEAFFWTYQGTYIQSNTAWRTDLWMDEDTSGLPGLRFMQIGDRRWFGLGGEEEPWLPGFLATEEEFEQPDPFYIWRVMVNITEGNRVAQGTRAFAGTACDEYRFTWQAVNDQGQEISQEVHLFVTPDQGLPVYVESVGRNQTTGDLITLTWELSHVNDPANIVEPPDE